MSCKLDNLTEYNCEKIPYPATSIQLTMYNIDEMVKKIETTNREATASIYDETAIMVRFANPLPRQCTPNVMRITDWLVIGENKIAKIYTDEEYKRKYRKRTGD